MKMTALRCIVSFAILFSIPSITRGGEAFRVGNFEFVKPDSWISQKPRSAMRKAELRVPGKADGELGEVVFFYFGAGKAGGTQANIDRWMRQFREPSSRQNARIEKAKAGETPVVFVYAEGTFMSGPPLGQKIPKAGFALLGAILEAKSGFLFVKFTGPKAVIQSAENDFKTMIVTAKN